MRIITAILMFIVILIGLSFAVLNAGAVTINYYVGTTSISLSLLLVITLTIGAGLGVLAMVVPTIRLRRMNRRVKKRAKRAEQEIENLRSIPIKDSH